MTTSTMENPADSMAGLNNRERYYAWRTEHAIRAWHRRDLEECQSAAHELLMVPLLPLWHRCRLNFYLAGVARLKDKPKYGKNCLRETFHYLAVLKQKNARNGGPENPAYNELQAFAEHLMMELEADLVSAQEKENILLEQESRRPRTSFEINMMNLVRHGTIEVPDNKDADTDMATESPEKSASNGSSSIILPIRTSSAKNDPDMEMAILTSQDDLLSRSGSVMASSQQNTPEKPVNLAGKNFMAPIPELGGGPSLCSKEVDKK